MPKNNYKAFYKCRWCQQVLEVWFHSAKDPELTTILLERNNPLHIHRCGEGFGLSGKGICDVIGVRKIRAGEIQNG